MSTRMLTTVCAAGCAGLLSLGGCLGSRTCNQGCSNLSQAAAKIVQDQLGSLNADDVQVLADLAIGYSGAGLPAVTDAQAAAVVTFLSDNHVQTIEDVQALIQQADDSPGSVVISDEVRQVIEQIITDPSAYINAAEGPSDDLDL